MEQNFLEILWNSLKLSYNHLNMIQNISRSKNSVSKICPEIPESKHFWRPTLNSYNSQTIWPIAVKI
jgi:hypothetical protein